MDKLSTFHANASCARIFLSAIVGAVVCAVNRTFQWHCLRRIQRRVPLGWVTSQNAKSDFMRQTISRRLLELSVNRVSTDVELVGEQSNFCANNTRRFTVLALNAALVFSSFTLSGRYGAIQVRLPASRHGTGTPTRQTGTRYAGYRWQSACWKRRRPGFHFWMVTRKVRTSSICLSL